MSLASQIRVEFTCEVCDHDCVDIVSEIRNRSHHHHICRQCDELLAAMIIDLVVDSVTLPDRQLAGHYWDPSLTPYNRTTMPIAESDAIPISPAQRWYVMAISVFLTITAGVLGGMLMNWVL